MAAAAFAVVVALVSCGDLSRLRFVNTDEVLIGDSAFAIANSESHVPVSRLWGHVIPEFKTINFYYPPAYFYALALAFRLFGFSPVTVAVLHIGVRLLGALLVACLMAIRGTKPVVIWAVAVLWFSLCRGTYGRPEDLGLFFVVAMVLVLSAPNERPASAALGGLLAGLAFLTHPVSLLLSAPIGASYALSHLRRRPVQRLMAFGTAASLTMGLWLLWIVPFRREFRALFLDMVVPDAASVDYVGSLASFFRFAAFGNRWGASSPVAFSRSSGGLLLVFVMLVVALRVPLQRILLLAGPLFLYVLLTCKNRPHDYATHWFNGGLLLACALVVALAPEIPIGRWKRYLLGVAASAAAAQIFIQATVSGLQLAGNLEFARYGVPERYQKLLSRIPPGQIVITREPFAFYTLRPNHIILWPAGLEGTTAGRYRYSTRYDPSARWLVLPRAVEHGGEGGKFSWNDDSLSWFESHFTKVDQAFSECPPSSWRCRFAAPATALYLYERR